MTDNAIRLAGAHHIRLPVADLERSFAWYGGLLGYQRDFDFKTDGRIVAYALSHPHGGPPLVLAHDPARAAAAAGLQGLALAVPDEAALRQLEALFDAHGVRHGGVQQALAGSKLPFVEDPDGHLIGFYMVGERERQPG